MRLQRLKITHLPGIREGFALEELEPGINVVTGPNASGKSSLVRALRHLIDEPPEPSGGALILEADLASDENTWTVIRTASQIVWQQKGQPVERPPLPRGNFLHCYWLSMDDLLEQGETERVILDRLRRELSGGFDLDAVRQRTPFDIGPRHGQSQQNTHRQKENRLREVSQEYQALDRERLRLPELDAAIREADAAATRARKTECAVDWLHARRERREAEARLELFPEGMDRLAGNEDARLEEYEARRERLQEERKDAERRRADAQAALEATGLADHAPEAADLDARRQDLEDIRQHQSRLEDRQRHLHEARAAETTALASLRPAGADVPSIDHETVDRAVRVAEALRHAQRRVLELEEAAGAQSSEPEKLAVHEALAAELRRWLRQLDPARLWRLIAGGGTALALALLAAGAAVWAGAALATVMAALAAGATGWLLWQFLAMRNQRAEAERRASEQDIEPPESWTIQVVDERLRTVEETVAALRLQEERAREAKVHRREIDQLRDELRDLEDQKNTLAEKIGFDPEVTGEGVARFAQLARDLDQARTKRAGLEGEIERERREIDDRLERVVAFLADYGIPLEESERDPATVRAQFQALEKRVAACRDAQRAIDDADRALARLAADLEEIEGDLARLYRDAGLEPGNRRALLECCERYEAYREERSAKQAAELREHERRQAVDDDPELVDYVERDDETSLRGLLEDLRETARQADSLRDDRADLKARLNQAGQDRALEQARQERDQALEELRDAHEQAMVAEVGHFLLDQVAEEHRSEHEPAVLAGARERFARYTHDRYVLEIEPGGRITARDTEQEIVQGPAELSTGTRMQLLMAVRLAWTGMLERDSEPLPIFLDEALTTTDPERFDSIARNLTDTADREGRQIFYLTAQPADVTRWERAIGRRPHHVDLPKIRFDRVGEEPADYMVAEREPVPEPGDMSAEEYAAHLSVPKINPRDGAGAIHIFHLLRDDLKLLHRLMNDWRITRLGPLERLLADDAAEHAVPNDELREQLRARCKAARTWVDLWLRGRGRPVNRNALEASGAVSGSFIDRVSDLADRLDGDARSLIEALNEGQVARFRQNKIDELAEWLQDNGYLDSEPPLSADQRMQETLRWSAGMIRPNGAKQVTLNLEAACRAGTVDAVRDNIQA